MEIFHLKCVVSAMKVAQIVQVILIISAPLAKEDTF